MNSNRQDELRAGPALATGGSTLSSPSRLGIALAICSLLSGCCTSRQRAREIDEALRVQNLKRAEPLMLRAAQRYGATLLPAEPRMPGFTPLCDSTGIALSTQVRLSATRADGCRKSGAALACSTSLQAPGC